MRKGSTSLVEKELAGELMVLDLISKKTYCLNRAAAFVWQHSDGNTSVDELARLLAEESGAPADRRVVEFALRSLDKEGLMEEVGLSNAVEIDTDRRKLFRKLGWAAAWLVALPLLTTVKASARPPSGAPPP
jgi:hypothetical protein